MAESYQKKLDRVRPPRVQIKYEVETNGAMQEKMLPFVVGVMADLSGNPEEALPKLKNRKFVEIDRDNFTDVLEGAKPRVQFNVDNQLKKDGSQIGVDITFSSLESFEPGDIVRNVDPLRKLLDVRNRLSELAAKIDGKEEVVDVLNQIIADTESLSQLKKETGSGADETPS